MCKVCEFYDDEIVDTKFELYVAKEEGVTDQEWFRDTQQYLAELRTKYHKHLEQVHKINRQRELSIGPNYVGIVDTDPAQRPYRHHGKPTKASIERIGRLVTGLQPSQILLTQFGPILIFSIRGQLCQAT